MAINLQKEQQKIVTNLETIFNAPSMKPALAQANLQSIIEKQLNILAYLEKTNKNEKVKSEKLLVTYNQLTNKHFVIDKNVKYEDDEILIDDINYLGVYIRNIYKIDLEALASGKEAKVSTPTVREATPQQAQGNPFPFMMPGMMGNLPPEQNPMYAAMANARLQQETAQGKVYLFKTKPKYIPILKWVISGLLFLFALSAIFIGVGMICAKGSSRTGNYDGTVSSITYFMVAVVAFFACYRNVMSLVNGSKNENRLYSFQWQSFAVLGLLFVMVLILGGAIGKDFTIFDSKSVPWAPGTETSKHMFGLWAWFLGLIFFFVSAGLLIAAIALGMVKGPKVDTERLNSLIRQYIDESMKAPPPTPPVGM